MAAVFICKEMNIRVGNGYDVHKLAEGEQLVLGGINIPHVKGTVAHSDGDVLIHAICDALLGAATLGDIGSHFPDTESKYKNIDSSKLLASTVKLVNTKGYQIGNIDSTVCLQQPKIGKYIPGMRKKLALITGLDIDNISIEATTTEKLGFVGREEGIAVYSVVLIETL